MEKKNNIVGKIEYLLQEEFKEGDTVKLLTGAHKGKKGKVVAVMDYGKAGKSRKKGKHVDVELNRGWKATLPVTDVVKE